MPPKKKTHIFQIYYYPSAREKNCVCFVRIEFSISFIHVLRPFFGDLTFASCPFFFLHFVVFYIFARGAVQSGVLFRIVFDLGAQTERTPSDFWKQ